MKRLLLLLAVLGCLPGADFLALNPKILKNEKNPMKPNNFFDESQSIDDQCEKDESEYFHCQAKNLPKALLQVSSISDFDSTKNAYAEFKLCLNTVKCPVTLGRLNLLDARVTILQKLSPIDECLNKSNVNRMAYECREQFENPASFFHCIRKELDLQPGCNKSQIQYFDSIRLHLIEYQEKKTEFDRFYKKYFLNN